jgi:uncharacterized protein
LRAKANEARGQGTAQATMLMGVASADDGTSNVSVSTDLLVSGRVAQMGQGIMQDVATRMIGEMAKNMEAMLTTGTAPEVADSVKAGSVVGAVAAERVKRLFGRGGEDSTETPPTTER